MRRLASLCAAGVLVAAAGGARADDCRELLRTGLYDLERSSPHADLERARYWLVTSAGGDAATARASAEALGVDPALFFLGVAGQRSDRDWNAWRAALLRADLSRLQLSPRLREVAVSTSAALRTALARCTAREGSHLWTEATEDPHVFRIHLRHAAREDGTLAVDRLDAFQRGPEGPLPVTCDPSLPHAGRFLLWKRKPRVRGRFVARCRRDDPASPVQVVLEAGGRTLEATLAPWLPARFAPYERAVPQLTCGATPGDGEGLRMRAECVVPGGELREDAASLAGWNARARASVECPSPDLPGAARAALSLSCQLEAGGSAVLGVSGELRAHAGWRRRGCLGQPQRDAGHCPAAALAEGHVRSELFVDLNSHHCAFATPLRTRGSGQPANNGSRAFGPPRFEPRFLWLEKPDGSRVPLGAGDPVALDAPGVWHLRAGGDGDAMPGAWRLEAPDNDHSGGFAFRQEMRVDILQARSDGTCGGTPPASTAGSRGAAGPPAEAPQR